jgi:hypothetical protein
MLESPTATHALGDVQDTLDSRASNAPATWTVG